MMAPTETLATLQALRLDPPDVPRNGLAQMVASLVGSEILKIAGEVRTLKASGKPICDLTVGDFSPAQFRIPLALAEGIERAMAAAQTNYPPADGVMALREAIQSFYERALGLAYPLEGILVAGGARPAIYSAYKTVLDPEDLVLYPVPSWNNNHYVHLAGARGLAIETRSQDGFLPTADALRPHLAKARLLALNSPLNPAGTGFSRDQLRHIAEAVMVENERREAAGDRPLYVLYDHIYWMLAADDAPHFTPVGLVPEIAPYTIFVDGISKSFAATGLRVGWAVGPPYLIARMRDLLGHVGAWAPRPEQVATAELLAAGGARAMANEIRGGLLDRLRALHDGLIAMRAEGLPVDALAPAGALYLSVRLDLNSRLGTNEQVRRHLLEHAGIALVPFQAFGLAQDTGWFRASVGAVSLDDIAAVLPRLRQVLLALR